MPKPASELRNVIGRLGHQYPRLAAKREGAELFGAPRLNAFMLFKPNEVRLSRIIADLFDPSGSHGQDMLFLNALLQSLKLPRVGVMDPVSVRREMVTKAGRQIDLVIGLPELIIGIENKPWAAQRPAQLSDYLEALKGWSRGRTAVLIFLSNKEPESAVDEVRIVRLHSDDDDEPSLNKIVAQCRDNTRAPRTKIHLDELHAYLAFEFGGTPMIDDADTPYVEAVEAEFERGADSRRALAMAMLANTALHEVLLDELSDLILNAARRSFKGIEQEDDDTSLFDALSDKDDWWGIRRPSWPANCSVAIAPGKMDYLDVYFGVRAPDGTKKGIDDDEACALRKVIAAAVADVEGGSSTAGWPWWKYAEPLSWTSEQLASLVLQSPTGKLADHPRVKDLIDRLIVLVAAVDKAVAPSR